MSFFGGPSSHRSSPRGNNNNTAHHKSTTRPVFPRAPPSSASFFSRNGGSSSHYKRRPRDGYVQSLVHKLKRLIRELWDYARRHPLKAFMAVVVPLISAGGALHSLLRQFGVRMPIAFDGVRSTRGRGYYESSGYGGQEHGGFGSVFGGGNAMNTVGSLLKVARKLM